MKPYKVYRNGKLFDIVYAENGTSPQKLKNELIKEGSPSNIEVKHYIKIKE